MSWTGRQPRPAAAATVRALASLVQPVPGCALSSMSPVLVSATSPPSGATGQRVRVSRERGVQQAGLGPLRAVVAAARHRGEGQVLAGPDRGGQGGTAFSRHRDPAVAGHALRRRQFPGPGLAAPDEHLPEVVVPGGGPAHDQHGPATVRVVGGGGQGQAGGRGGRGRLSGVRAAATGQPGRRDGGQQSRARAAPAPGDHEAPRVCRAAAESSLAKDAWVLDVPGPGSKLSSVRVRPDRSMT